MFPPFVELPSGRLVNLAHVVKMWFAEFATGPKLCVLYVGRTDADHLSREDGEVLYGAGLKAAADFSFRDAAVGVAMSEEVQ